MYSDCDILILHNYVKVYKARRAAWGGGGGAVGGGGGGGGCVVILHSVMRPIYHHV